MTTAKVKEDLQGINQQLRAALGEIEKNNSKGGQMDYCTHPSITTEIDVLLNLVKKIDKMWYQK